MNGILIIDKPTGKTSRDVVNEISKKFNTKKVGHTGTLDPIATGVLVVCVGYATKLSSDLTFHDKEYIAECTLGIETDTLDIEGKVLNKIDTKIGEKEIVNALNSFKGSYLQEVPAYSAVKVKGKKLYEYAREGKSVELPKRLVNISSIELIDDIEYEDNTTKFKFKCTVSKGTYIRSLIRDIANKLNTVGIMTNLRRVRVGNFKIEDAKTIDNITNKDLINIKDILDIKKVNINESQKKLIYNGSIIDNKYNSDEILFMKDNEPICIYRKYDKDNTKLKPYKMFKGGIL